MQIFGQVWLWSLGSFLLGAVFTWLLLVRPMRRRLIELEASGGGSGIGGSGVGDGMGSGLGAARPELPPTRFAEPMLAPPAPPGPTAADRSLDDLFDSQVKSTPPQLPPLTPSPAPVPDHSGISGRLDPTGPTAPPEPPLTPAPQQESDTELSDGSSWQAFTESTTVFVPPSDLPSLPSTVEPTGQDWFVKETQGELDPHAITDVEDDEHVDDTGTIFTQHTTPIPAEVIRSLDESQPIQQVPAETPAELTQAIIPPAPSRHELPEPEPEPKPAGTHAFTPPEPEPELTQAFAPPQPSHTSHAYEPAEDAGRSLFEPVVPVADHADDRPGDFVPPGPFGPGSAMPLPGGGSPAPEFNVKASVTALRYCTKDNPQFDRIVAEVWFRSPSDAERVGFRVLS